MTMLPNVEYSRNMRVYQVFGRNGTTAFTIPAGKQGRKFAHQFAVLTKNPELHGIVSDWIAQYPQIESRAWRAAEIVLNDDVMPSFTQQYAAVVASQGSEYGDYNILVKDDSVICECDDFQGFTAPMVGDNLQPLCKHALAFMFNQHLGILS